MSFLIFLFVLLPLASLAVYALTTVAPFLDRILFNKIWEDPRPKQRQAILKRISEFQERVPEDTALLLAAKELSSDEDELLQVTEAVNPGDLARMASGSRAGAGGMLNAIQKLWRL